ncbi:UNVERIFIED_CONTAM: hypothetical protein Sradi_3337100 [Sesamum radiatum]|uniref:Uncharacterized protein n=1 Tax=Sesamum radiatum TaxID=300843 RepID=A0AAW2R2B4_SESRA
MPRTGRFPRNRAVQSVRRLNWRFRRFSQFKAVLGARRFFGSVRPGKGTGSQSGRGTARSGPVFKSLRGNYV